MIALILLALTVVGLGAVVATTQGNKISSGAAGKALLIASSLIAAISWLDLTNSSLLYSYSNLFYSPYSGEGGMLIPTLMLWVLVGVDSLSPSALSRRLTASFGYVLGGGFLIPVIFGGNGGLDLGNGSGLLGAFIPGVGMIVGATLLASSEVATRNQPVVPTQPAMQQYMPVQSPMPGSLPPANWYPDPSGLQVLRFWDGTRWTDHQQPIPAPSGPAQ